MTQPEKELSTLGKKAIKSIRKEILSAPSNKGRRYHGSHVSTRNLLDNTKFEVEQLNLFDYKLVLTLPEYADELDQGQSGDSGGVQRETPYTFDASVRDIRAWLQNKGWTPSIGTKRTQTLQSFSKQLHKRLLYSGVRPTYFLQNALKRVFPPRIYDELATTFANKFFEATLTKLEENGWKK